MFLIFNNLLCIKTISLNKHLAKLFKCFIVIVFFYLYNINSDKI
nr:MAG TPA: hypothetical protein [Caudoviricetes sp.]